MTELEKKQLLVDLIKTAAGDYYENDSYKNLNANDSTFSGLKGQLDFLLRNRLELTIDEERTGAAQAIPKEPVQNEKNEDELDLTDSELELVKNCQNQLKQGALNPNAFDKLLNLCYKLLEVPRYSKKELVSFGNYLLSPKREAMVSEINKNNVTHADISNWKDEEAKERDLRLDNL